MEARRVSEDSLANASGFHMRGAPNRIFYNLRLLKRLTSNFSSIMKITKVEALVLQLPNVTAACDGTQDTCLVRVETDTGIVGWGEVDSCPTAVKAIIDAPLSHQLCNGLANAVTGCDPLAIEACMQRMQTAANYYGR